MDAHKGQGLPVAVGEAFAGAELVAGGDEGVEDAFVERVGTDFECDLGMVFQDDVEKEGACPVHVFPDVVFGVVE